MYRKTGSLVFLVSLLSFSANVGADIVGRWRFDEGSGTVAQDSSGYDRHGTLQGNPQWVSGIDGGALEFDGTADYVNIDGYKGILGGAARTVAAWVKTTSSGTSDGNSSTIVEWGSNSGGQRMCFRVYGGRLRCEHGNGNLQADTSLADDEWHHVAVVVTENATISNPDVKLYLDGEDDTRDTTDGDAFNTTAGPDVSIGRRPVTDTRFFDGLIDDVRIYDAALTAEQIQQLATATKAHDPQPADGAQNVGLFDNSGMVTWDGTAGAVWHNVYYGTASPPPFVARQPLTSTFYAGPRAANTTYHWRVDEEETDGTIHVGEQWSFITAPAKVHSPAPADGLQFVELDTVLTWSPGFSAVYYDVYFGLDETAVANAAKDSTEYKGTHYVATYAPGALAPYTSYYWRIDSGTEEGDVWSFTTMPVIPIAEPNNICWWPCDEGQGPTALDWSGHGYHGGFAGDPQWVQWYDGYAVELDGIDDEVIVSLAAASVWPEFTVAVWVKTDTPGQDQYSSVFSGHSPNSAGFQLDVDGANPGNYRINPAGLIFGSVSTDWVHLAITCSGPSATLYYNGALASSGTLTDTDKTFNQFAVGRNRNVDNKFAGTIDDLRVYDRALTGAEVQQLTRIDPMLAWNPSPLDGSKVDVAEAMQLSWLPGDAAKEHDVYLGADEATVSDAGTNSPEYRGRQSATAYNPVDLEFGKTFFWRVDEVNEPHVWKGHIWSFELADYGSVDDFDSYADTNALLLAWEDGGTNGSGATVSLESEFGSGLMALAYDNNQPPFHSRAELTYDTTQDWTAGGATALEVLFRGDVNNAAEPLYIALEDGAGKKAAVVHADANALLEDQWQSWRTWVIPLQEFADFSGVDLTAVKKIAIRVGDGLDSSAGERSGSLYLDYVRLYPPRCFPERVAASFNDDCVTDIGELETIARYWLASDYDVAAAKPEKAHLLVHYRFDETSGAVAQDSSGRGFHATVDANGANAWDPCGYDAGCLDFDGTFSVVVPGGVFSDISDEVTISVWVHVDANANPNALGRAEFSAGPAESNEPWDQLAWIQDEGEDYTGLWSHYAFVKDAGSGMMRIYHNGLLVAQNTDAFQSMDGVLAGQSTIGSRSDSSGGYYKGKLDDFRIYDYALSHAEVLHLAAGSGGALHQPLRPVLSPVDPFEDGQVSFLDFAVLAEWWLKEALWP